MSLVKKLNKSHPIVMGIDSNTNNIAFAIYKEKQLIHYGKVEFNKGDIYERIRSAGMISRALANKWNIDYIAVEASVFVNSPQVAIKMAMCLGAIISGLMHSGKTEVIAISPRAWQSYIGNKTYTKVMKQEVIDANPGKSTSWISNHIRNTRKQFTIDFFNEMFKTNISDNDVSDACGIGWYAANETLTESS